MQMNQDFLEKINETIERARTYADKSEKRRRTQEDWSCSRAGEFLISREGTIAWDGPLNCPFGYTSIWEYCAGEYHGAGTRAMEKARLAKEFAADMKNGFNRLKERLFEEHGIVLLMIPRIVNDLKIAIITADPEYVVSESLTAGQIQLERDQKLVKGQLTASHSRMSGLDGADSARHVLSRVFDEVIASPVPTPNPSPFALPQPEGAPA